MKNLLISINKKIINRRYIFQGQFNSFVNSRFFWIITFVLSVLYIIFSQWFFFNLHWFLGIVFLLFSAFFSVTLLPGFYYKTRGIDFFIDFVLNKKEKKLTNEITVEDEIRTPLKKEHIEELYLLLLRSHLLDYTSLQFKTDVDLEKVFSYEHFEKVITELYIYGKSDDYLYITSNQKELSYLLFDLFKPFLNRKVSAFYINFFFTQKKSFKPVNYDSISREENRGIIQTISDALPNFLQKVRFSK